MWPLVAVSLLMWALIIQRLLCLKGLYDHNMAEAQAIDYARRGVLPPAEYAGITSRLVSEFVSRKSGYPQLDGHVVDEALLTVAARLERGLTLIGVLAAIAPLLGLLGTVVGMITTFDSIALFGTGNARAMAGGISEALVTTQTGLLIAIPGLYMRNFLQRRAENLKQRLSSLGLCLKRELSRELSGESVL
ncbi:MAG: MotA/TolQ/ExbB proton channel family protein [Desulfuromonas sp.]|nr:MotA/TolQ/ExbB proton channel family protein [Desulfuromonas sp.]